MLKVQVVSDLHLEFRGYNFQKIIKPSAPVLFLVGDICACGTYDDYEIYKKFMTFLSPKFKYIFHVPGNHEYYTVGNKNIELSDTVPGIDSKLKKFCNTFKNVFYLNNNTVRLNIDNQTYVIIGSTLWSHVLQKNRKEMGSLMNDYTHIYMPNVSNTQKPDQIKDIENQKHLVRKYTIDDMTNIHEKSVRYIKKEMKKVKPNEIAILLTHHKPVRDVDISDIVSQAYETDLKDIIIKRPFKLACFGHTHIKYDKIINNVRIVSNPKGYISQKTMYNAAFVIEV